MKPGISPSRLPVRMNKKKRTDDWEKVLIAGPDQVFHEVQNRLEGHFQCLLHDARVFDAQSTPHPGGKNYESKTHQYDHDQMRRQYIVVGVVVDPFTQRGKSSDQPFRERICNIPVKDG